MIRYDHKMSIKMEGEDVEKLSHLCDVMHRDRCDVIRQLIRDAYEAVKE